MFKFDRSPQNKKGFTLIELLIVIAIIAIIAGVIFVALDPLRRFRDARDSRRWSDAAELLLSIKIDQIDNGGTYLSNINTLTDGYIYMIGIDPTGCDDYNTACDTNVTNDTACVNLTGLVTDGYLGSVPISPTGAASWTSGHTGYTLEKSSTGIITIRACEFENSLEEIELSR